MTEICEPITHGAHSHCSVDTDCGDDYMCEYGWCYVTHSHTSCLYNAECEEDTRCYMGYCEPIPERDCWSDTDCTDGKICYNTKCVED
jgi:hypothetical protein